MNAINEAISKIGVVPVIKLSNPERDAVPLAKALCAGGVPVAEVTFRAAGADTAIRLMREACPEMIVGAGTVTATAHIDSTITAGGQFIVTPGFDPELVAYAQQLRARARACAERKPVFLTGQPDDLLHVGQKRVGNMNAFRLFFQTEFIQRSIGDLGAGEKGRKGDQ